MSEYTQTIVIKCYKYKDDVLYAKIKYLTQYQGVKEGFLVEVMPKFDLQSEKPTENRALRQKDNKSKQKP